MFSRKSTRRFAMYIFAAALALTSCNAGATAAPPLDVDALKTAIVETTIAQISAQSTQTALAIPTNTSAPAVTDTSVASPTLDPSIPTSTLDVSLIPTFSLINTPVIGANTPVPGATTPVVILPTTQPTSALVNECDNVVFTGVEFPLDFAIFKPGEDFKKEWELVNKGNCTWDEGYAFVFVAGDKAIDPYTFEFKKSEDFVSPGEAIKMGIRLTAPLAEGDYEGHWKMRNDKGYYFGNYFSVYFTVRK